MPDSPSDPPTGEPSEPLVGSPAARAVRGRTFGAECVLLDADTGTSDAQSGEGAASLDDVLTEACRPTKITTVARLADLADIADAGTGPLVLADRALRISLPATLDLLDTPGDRTAALLADVGNIEAPRQRAYRLDRATLARVAPDSTIESTSTARHTVTQPNRVVVGMLRIDAADRQRAAELWRAAAGQPGRDVDLFDLALLVLVRGALVIKESALGYHTWSRRGTGMQGLGASSWRQRLRSSSRLGDGAYSTAVVRPLSRIGTRLALGINLAPNVITLISLLVGIGAGVLIFTGNPLAWIGAAVLLQLALVIDCMDGEVARFTRRFSALGAWLDGIGDRIKEYLVFAAVAAVAARDGQPYGWLLAVIAMVVVTARHLEDYSYTDRNAPDRVSSLRPRPLTDPADGADSLPARTSLPDPPDRRTKIIFWAKKIAHVPIAERYLILSLGLLTLQPVVVLVAALAVSVFALAWTVGGRFVRAVRTPRPSGGAELDQQLDLGPLARSLGRRLATNPRRLGWLALPAVWVIEAGVVIALWAFGAFGWMVFVTVAVLAFRRYELIYSIRLGTSPPKLPTLGVELRVLLVAGAALVAYGVTGAASFLNTGLVVIAVATLAETLGAIITRRPRA